MAIRRLRCALLVPLTCLLGLTSHARGADAQPAELPLVRVVLFTSGVGYFEHRGEVRDNAQVDLKFNVDDINDLLKSMVLEDQGGGRISTVTYGSRDPLLKTLKTFSIDLTREPTLGDLLRQVRGEEVRIETPAPLTGKILGVERREQKIGKDETVDVEMLTLVTPTGLKSIPLESIGEIRLLSEQLNSELQDALTMLTQIHSRDKKTVSLKFTGKGEYRVRIGYILEAPLWKTSYRLVLDHEDKPLLQGWAILENTTDHDWDDVDLALVSGRPISFMMDLYRPLYVARPLVAPETYATLRPQSHAQDLADREDALRRSGQREGVVSSGPGFGGRRGKGDMGGGMGGMGGGMGGAFFGGMGGFDSSGSRGGSRAAPTPMDPAAGVETTAQGDETGELFRYQIAEPVKLARQQAAMLPIVNETVKAEKQSLYNPTVHAKHPLNAVQLRNTTSLHLMQGPITVFDGGEYAGDARIEDLAPESRRLITYALDLDTEVASHAKSAPQRLVSMRCVAGTLQLEHHLLKSVEYTIKNSGSGSKQMLIEQAIDPEWTLVEPKPAEKTRSLYRFGIEAPAGKRTKLVVQEQKRVKSEVAIKSFDWLEMEIGIYLESDVASPALKEAIREVLKQQQAASEVEAELSEMRGRLNAVSEEQSRIRQNMGQLDRTDDLYKRYVKKFATQEDEVERLGPQIKELTERLAKLKAELERYLANLTVD